MNDLESYWNDSEYHFDNIPNAIHGLDIYEFGVYGGVSLKLLTKQLSQHQIYYNKIFAFDSFKGLPEEAKYVPRPELIWDAGKFNCQELYEDNNTKNIIQHIRSHISKYHNYNLEFIEGFFDKILNSETVLKYNLRPASYINIDVDLYSSTFQVLDFIFKNGLAIPGTIIRYDDWVWGRRNGDGSFGNSKAHNEIQKKYNISFTDGKFHFIKIVVDYDRK